MIYLLFQSQFHMASFVSHPTHTKNPYADHLYFTSFLVLDSLA